MSKTLQNIIEKAVSKGICKQKRSHDGLVMVMESLKANGKHVTTKIQMYLSWVIGELILLH